MVMITIIMMTIRMMIYTDDYDDTDDGDDYDTDDDHDSTTSVSVGLIVIHVVTGHTDAYSRLGSSEGQNIIIRYVRTYMLSSSSLPSSSSSS